MTLAYTLHAMTQYHSMKEMEDDKAFQILPSPYRMFDGPWRMTESDTKQAERIKNLIQTTCENMITETQKAAQDFTNNLYGFCKPEIHHKIWEIGSIFIRAEVVEHLRYEFTGRNSSIQSEPPHLSCVQSIFETGRANPFDEL